MLYTSSFTPIRTQIRVHTSWVNKQNLQRSDHGPFKCTPEVSPRLHFKVVWEHLWWYHMMLLFNWTCLKRVLTNCLLVLKIPKGQQQCCTCVWGHHCMLRPVILVCSAHKLVLHISTVCGSAGSHQVQSSSQHDEVALQPQRGLTQRHYSAGTARSPYCSSMCVWVCVRERDTISMQGS